MTRTKLAVALVVVGAVVVTARPLPAAAATAEPDPAVAFSEVLEVGVVNLEVVVTDRRGTRVDGLERGDFRLWVDGEEQPIDFFTEIRAGIAASTASGGAAIPGATPGEPVATSYLVFIDDFFSIRADRNRVLAALSDQLGLLGARDRMAVVAWDGNHLEMLSSWSGSETVLARSLAQAAERPSDGLQRLVERQTFEREMELLEVLNEGPRQALGSKSSGIAGSLTAVHFVEKVQEQVERAASAATSTLRAFASPPGRKVMLLLSGGWPAQPVEWAVADPALNDRMSATLDTMKSLVHTANLLGYTLYPVDVPGMSRDSAVSAAHSEALSTLALFRREDELHYTLERLARPTGGRALLNGLREVALEEVAADTRSYYWLGFTADRKFDERQRRVRIEVTRPGLRLRHREGFQDFSRQREVTMAVESALLFGSEAAPRTLPMQLGAARRSGIGKVEVPLELAIPVDQVTFLHVAEGWTTQLELRVAVLDDAGRTTDVPVVPITFRLDEQPEAGTFLAYSTSMRLRRERHELLVSLYDPASGGMLSSRLEVDPK